MIVIHFQWYKKSINKIRFAFTLDDKTDLPNEYEYVNKIK